MISSTDRKLDYIDNQLNVVNVEKMVGLLTVPSSGPESTTTTAAAATPNNLHEQLKKSLSKLKHSCQLNPTAQSQIVQIECTLAHLLDKINEPGSPSSSSSSSGSSSPLASSSSAATSPVLLNADPQQQQPIQPPQPSEQTAQTSPSSFSIRSSSSSSSLSTVSSSHHNHHQPQQSSNHPVIGDVNESNVKKIISRLLSQNYVNSEPPVHKSASHKSTTKQISAGTLVTSSNSNNNFTQCFYYLDKSAHPNAVTIFKK